MNVVSFTNSTALTVGQVKRLTWDQARNKMTCNFFPDMRLTSVVEGESLDATALVPIAAGTLVYISCVGVAF
jgi:hypothetical protein